MIHTVSTTSPASSEVADGRAMRGMAHAARGFSLIELMIAMVLGLLVVAGLINLFVANRKAYQVQSGNNYLQENMRIASDRMGWSLRMVDFWGGNKAAGVTVDASATGTVNDKGDCDGTWATAITYSSTGGGGIFGYDGAASSPIDSTCIGGTANYVPGSDVLVLRYADPQVLSPGPVPVAASTITGNADLIFLLSTPGNRAELFAGSVPAPQPNATLMRYAYPYQIEMYYLRPCNVMTGSTCTASADGGQPLPTLMRMRLSDGNFVSDPVVDGIEQLKVEYGEASPATGIALEYHDADAVGNWANVISARISLVAVNPVRDLTVPHVATYTVGNCTYTINNGKAATTTGCADFKPYGDKPWQFVRASQQFVVQLRNRVRG